VPGRGNEQTQNPRRGSNLGGPKPKGRKVSNKLEGRNHLKVKSQEWRKLWERKGEVKGRLSLLGCARREKTLYKTRDGKGTLARVRGTVPETAQGKPCGQKKKGGKRGKKKKKKKAPTKIW